MCGIAGAVFFKEDKNPTKLNWVRDFMSSLLVETQVRGNHATGIAVINGKKHIVAKNNVPAKLFVSSPEYIEAMDSISNATKSIVAHCRYATKGLASNNANNHPIITNRMIGVHNGHINNDDALFKKYNMPRTGQVDSEVVYRMFDRISKKFSIHNAQKIMDELSGGMALAFVNKKQPNILYLAKNHNPIELAYFPQLKMMVFASELKFIKEAVRITNDLYGDSFQVGIVEFRTLGYNKMFMIDSSAEPDLQGLVEYSIKYEAPKADTTNTKALGAGNTTATDDKKAVITFTKEEYEKIAVETYKNGYDDGYTQGWDDGASATESTNKQNNKKYQEWLDKAERNTQQAFATGYSEGFEFGFKMAQQQARENHKGFASKAFENLKNLLNRKKEEQKKVV